ncbi:MAG: alanine racemase [Bacillota bacterium]|nr:alanine racemase [Bacillota bacterium]
MFRHLRPVWAEINLDCVENNIREIRKVSKSREIIGVIKADAYGHGAVDLAPVLLQNGADSFAVAVLSEAVELRRSGIDCPIMVLGFTPPNLVDNILRYDIEQTVYSYDFAKELSAMAVKKNKLARIHIVLDTGMGRIGFIPDNESLDEVEKISHLPNIIIEGMFTHFSTADEENKEFTKKQLSIFNEFYKDLTSRGVKIKKRHTANSAAISDFPESHFEAVRPGIILYGYYPSDYVQKDKIHLKRVLTLKTNIVLIKNVPKGCPISYGRRFYTERDSIIATLPVGYADGYTRLLFNKGKVIINGKYAKVVGSICMDQCMVDITDIPEVKVGDEVILLGEDGVKYDADDMADDIGTISYEVLTMISKRVPRVYTKDGKVVKIRNYV